LEREVLMRVLGSVLLVLALISTSGLADAKIKLKKACGADLERFCKDVKRGEGRKACLRTHLQELRPSCAEALKERDAEKAAKKGT
jgi:hypothetical protein